MNDEEKPKYKQAIILRKDLKMGCGKACAQAAHASFEVVWEHRGQMGEVGSDRGVKNYNQIINAWIENGYHKIVLAAGSEKELVDVFVSATRNQLPCVIIEDFGLTQLEPGTKTAVGIGPARVEDLNKVAGHLKLY